MQDTDFDVLFICSGNSARSIFAEALLRDLGRGKFQAFSAGTRPNTELNPFALEVLKRNGHDVSGLRSKHISEFQQPGAIVMDFVFTVCDTAAGEEGADERLAERCALVVELEERTENVWEVVLHKDLGVPDGPALRRVERQCAAGCLVPANHAVCREDLAARVCDFLLRHVARAPGGRLTPR
jgi:protein-tyrosine-phosphatase